MGCFLACFGSSKEGKRRRKKPANKVQPRDQRNGFYEPLQPGISIEQDRIERPISSISESRDKLEEQLSFGARKKVTFDLNVQAYEEPSTQEITDKPVGGDEKAKERKKNEEKAVTEGHSPDNSITSSLGSYPSNHRYQNCSNSDDDEYGDESDGEESDLEDDFFDDDEGDQEIEGESSESFFSLPTEPKPGGSSSSTLLDEKEVNSPAEVAATTHDLKALSSNQNARDRSHYVHSVLNPVENLTQWKAVKAKTATPPPPLKPPQKENASLDDFHVPFSSEPSFKTFLSWKTSSDQSSLTPKQEIAVDASLSNWLSSSETTPSINKTGNNISESAERSLSPRSSLSLRSLEDRPILGALTVEEIKQMNASSSPRRSPTWSPDEKPIVGTVGSYWSHTGQNTSSSSSSCSIGGIPNTTSKYREDKRVNWHSTPFETRLERALNTGVAEAYSNHQTRV